MPEMPEVAGLVEFLREHLAGSRVASVQIAAISAIKTADPALSDAEGRLVLDVLRRGKFLCLALGESDGGPDGSAMTIAVHLSRAGWVRWSERPRTTPVRMGRGPLAARFTFVDDAGEIVGGFELTEAGTQKRLAVYTARSLDDVPGIARLGPDPLDPSFSEESLSRLLSEAGARQLKTVLRDQTVLAGVGNAYSDEVLHAAKLSPAARCDTLSPDDLDRLFRSLRDVLGEAVVAASGRPPAALKDAKRAGMRVHGRAGELCSVCGDTIREVSTADSAYQYCPTCQTGGKPLADRRMSRLLK